MYDLDRLDWYAGRVLPLFLLRALDADGNIQGAVAEAFAAAALAVRERDKHPNQHPHSPSPNGRGPF